MRLKHNDASVSAKTLGLSVAIAAGLMCSTAPAFADTVRLDYSVSHSKYGHIGSFSNTIDTEGQNTTVTTNENIAVKVIGITAFRQQAQRVEKWNGDKLTYFHAVTNINGKSTTVDGAAASQRRLSGFYSWLPRRRPGRGECRSGRLPPAFP